MSKYCPRCGAATERNAAFCQNCGAKIPQEQPPASNSNTNTYHQNHRYLFHHNNQEDFILNSQTKRNLLWYSKLLQRLKVLQFFG